MNKKELEKLRTLNATKGMIEALHLPGKKMTGTVISINTDIGLQRDASSSMEY